MLSFSKINRDALGKILGIRNQSNFSDKEELGGAADFSFPHETYSIGLNELMMGIPKPERSGLRVIEVLNDSFKYIYEIYKDAGPQMFRDRVFITDYEKAFENIAGGDQMEDEYTVRTLRVPALNVDALWLHDVKNESLDKFIPVRSVGQLEKNQTYSRDEFFASLRRAAKNLQDQDDLMGA